jgi:hypothetical protein
MSTDRNACDVPRVRAQFFFATVAVVFTASGRVAAQAAPTSPAARPPVAAPADQVTESEALVQQGIAQRRAGEDQAALETFRRANALTPSPRIRAQVALAEQALGQWASADTDLRAALREENDPWIQRNRASLEAALTSIGSRLATVELSCNHAGATLLINGREVGTFPLAQPLRLESGSAALEVRMQGYRTIRRTIDVEGGRSFRENFALVALNPDDDVDVGNGVQPSQRLRVRTVRMTEEYVAPRGSSELIVVGSGLLVVGVGAHLIWQNRVNLYNSGSPTGSDRGNVNVCFNPSEYFPTRAERCDAVLAESWAALGVTLAGYVLGGVALGTGAALRLFRSERRVREVSAELRAAPALASVSCVPSVAQVGVQCVGTF